MPMTRRQIPLDLEADDAAEPAASRREFLLHELRDVLARVFAAAGPASPDALATRAIEAIADHLGGQEVYLPRGDRLRRALRDDAICRAWREGKPYWALAHEHNVSVERIRQILRRFENPGS